MMERAGTDGLRIFVDARMLRAAGIGRYLRPIVRGVVGDPRFERVVLAGDPDAFDAETVADTGLGRRGRLEVIPWTGGSYSPRAHLAWPLRVAPHLRGIDVAFFPHYDVPLGPLPPCVVVTVHDLTHFVLPELFPWVKRAPAGLLLRHAVGRADRVLVGSESTRRHLLERLPGAEPKVEAFSYGFSHELAQELLPSAALRSGAMGGVGPVDPRAHPVTADLGAQASAVRTPYILCVGNRKPHKNLGMAVRVLVELEEAFPDLRLVFAGGSANDGWDAVLRLADELRVADRVVDTGRVSDAELVALYRHTAALLILSRNEGFGYPALEAMALGAPVIASAAGSLPEVIGEAGILVDPHDPGDAASAVRRLLVDCGLRDRLATAGPSRAAAFSEQEMVARTLNVLVEAARAPAPVQPYPFRKA